MNSSKLSIIKVDAENAGQLFALSVGLLEQTDWRVNSSINDPVIETNGRKVVYMTSALVENHMQYSLTHGELVKTVLSPEEVEKAQSLMW